MGKHQPPAGTQRSSFENPAAVRLALFAALALVYGVFAWFTYRRRMPVLCPFRRLTSLRCPLCGFTTSTGHLLHGDLGSALRAHPLGPAVWILGSFWYLRSLKSVATPMAPLTQGALLTEGDKIPLWLRIR
jgi:Protein of unknown function (DUF2752)